jgi:hypothetical protein
MIQTCIYSIIFKGSISNYFHLDPKDRNKVIIAPEPPSSSSNVVISNEDDSSLGDYTKDSKVSLLKEKEWCHISRTSEM